MKRYVKDKNATRTYQVTWSTRLGDETIDTSTWTPDYDLWAAETDYLIDDIVRLADGTILEATVAGASGNSEPSAPSVGATVVDGGVTWLRSFTVDSDDITSTFTQITVSGGTKGKEYGVTNHVVSDAGQAEDETLVWMIIDK